MGIYERYVLPRIFDRGLKGKGFAKIRSRLVPLAEGDVLEIGMGPGHNLAFYSDAVRSITGVEPSEQLREMARARAEAMVCPIDFVGRVAEDIPAESGSFDSVVVTWTLCSIQEVERALGEMRRVLKPTGKLMFAEHGLAPDERVQRWQHRLNPIWKKIGGGCNLNRPMASLIEGAGFAIEDLDAGYIPGPRFAAYMYRGVARPR